MYWQPPLFPELTVGGVVWPCGAAQHRITPKLIDNDLFQRLGFGLGLLRLKMAQKPYMIWSLSPKASKYESSEP